MYLVHASQTGQLEDADKVRIGALSPFHHLLMCLCKCARMLCAPESMKKIIFFEVFAGVLHGAVIPSRSIASMWCTIVLQLPPHLALLLPHSPSLVSQAALVKRMQQQQQKKDTGCKLIWKKSTLTAPLLLRLLLPLGRLADPRHALLRCAGRPPVAFVGRC